MDLGSIILDFYARTSLEGESCFASQKPRDRWTHFLNHFKLLFDKDTKISGCCCYMAALALALLLAKTGSIKNKVDR